jgi:hypothetical protein
MPRARSWAQLNVTLGPVASSKRPSLVRSQLKLRYGVVPDGALALSVTPLPSLVVKALAEGPSSWLYAARVVR